MQLNDLFFTNMIFSSVGKINTGYIIIDIIYMMIMSSLMFYMFQSNFKQQIGRFVSGYISKYDKTNKLIFSTSDKDISRRFKSVMHWISKNNDPTVKTLTEVINIKYNRRSDDYEETKGSIYRVDQVMQFIIDVDICGKVYNQEKEKTEINGKTTYSEVVYLEVFSKKLRLTELEDWVEQKTKEYDTYLRLKNCDKQLLIEISWNPKEKDIAVYSNPWESNVTFANRFFTNKNEILDKINFFIKNPDWYKRRGIPYTLGFLLWGEPGCGKTGFIKALMNLTGRHGMSIKLNNRFDMNKLRDIIYDDDVCDDIIIPQKNRILIFEDIDCMGDIVKDRNLKDSEKSSDSDSEDYVEPINKVIKKKKQGEYDESVITKLITDSDNNYNNNLSYFLNIIDGLQECPGRIIIMTTNKPERLDKAFIRPGRVDFKINFTKASVEDIKNMLEFYWTKSVHELPDRINNIYSHAEITNFCRTSESLEESITKIINEGKNNISTFIL